MTDSIEETTNEASTRHSAEEFAEIDELANTLADLARSLEHEEDPAHTIEGIVQAAMKLIPGAEEASISMVVDRRLVMPQATTCEMAANIDAVQTDTNQGPCLDAIYQHRTVHVPDMRTEERWPDFAKRAYELGAASMLSFQLFVTGNNLGSLNLFSSKPNAFTEESEHIGLLFAAHAAVAFADMRKQEQLGVALETRDLIGQAKGILMERHQVTADTAFRILARHSQDSNLKLRDVAANLVRQCEAKAKPPR